MAAPRQWDPVIGSNARTIRELRGLSQKYVALEANITPSTLSKFENGKADLYLHQIIRLLRVLDCTIQQLLDLGRPGRKLLLSIDPATEARVISVRDDARS